MPEFDGIAGAVAERWGVPGRPAFDFRHADGRSRLFWFHELEEADAP